MDVIETLLDDQVLSPGNAKSLLSKLDTSQKQMDPGNTKAAINTLNAFINHVAAFVKTGILSEIIGQQLIDAANGMIAQIGDSG